MKFCISLGKLDIKYFIMIAISIGTFFAIVYAFDLFTSDKKKYIGKYREDNKLLKSFLKYLGQSYFVFGEIIRKKIAFKKDDKPINFINKKDILIIFIVSLAVLFGEFLAIFLKIKTKGFISLDERYNSIEFIFLFTTSLFIFKIRYYKHQYISIIAIIVLELSRYFTRLIKTESKDYRIHPFVEFLLQILRALIDSVFLGYSKALMEFKFFSPYKATYIFGLICLITVLIAYIILSFISFIPDEENKDHCFVKYNYKCYIENFFSIFSNFSFIQFLSFFIYSFCSGIYQFLFDFIVKDFTMCHIFLYYQFYAFYSSRRRFSIMDSFELTIIIITGIAELFITFVFLEIIQLNCCGLNENIKKNIQKRALLDSLDERSRNNSMASGLYADDDYYTNMKELKNKDNEEVNLY